MFGLIFLEHYISLLHLEPMYSRNISHSLTQWFCLTCDSMLSTCLGTWPKLTHWSLFWGNSVLYLEISFITSQKRESTCYKRTIVQGKHLLQAYFYLVYSTGKALGLVL
uniref:Uncharacterized protein n=1 Tax=Cacopsylla melanoneura TaxID=428564 RepID=A0A8D9BQQ9_9HEMI